MEDFELGATYRDIATGFEGIATSVTTFLYSCDRVWLVKGHNEKGEEIGTAFDITGLVLVKPASEELRAAMALTYPAEATQEADKPLARTGGDRPLASGQREDTHHSRG